MKKHLLFAAFVILGIYSLRADDAQGSATPTDNAIVDPAKINAHYREVLTRPPFQETAESRIDSRFEDWLSQWFRQLGTQIGDFKFASSMPAFESLLMTVLVTFSIGTLLYIAVRLKRRRDGLEENRSSDAPGEKAFRPPEFYDQEIIRAVADEDWHTAWLAAWRQFLSRLEKHQLVDADRTRTNREYLAQLIRHPLPDAALALLPGMVDSYDRFIYGRKWIGEPDWNFFRQQIDETTLLLNLDGKAGGAKEARRPS